MRYIANISVSQKTPCGWSHLGTVNAKGIDLFAVKADAMQQTMLFLSGKCMQPSEVYLEADITGNGEYVDHDESGFYFNKNKLFAV